MRLGDIFDITEVFHPRIFISSDIALTMGRIMRQDYYKMNSKRANKNETMYDQFLEKNYFSKLYDIFKDHNVGSIFDQTNRVLNINSNPLFRNPNIKITYNIADEGARRMCKSFPPQILLADSYSKTGKDLHFSYGYFLSIIFSEFNPELIKKIASEAKTQLDLLKFEPEIKEVLRNKRKELREIQKDGENHPNYEKLLKELEQERVRGSKFTLETFCESKIIALTRLIKGLPSYHRLFSTPIKIEELMNCFDYDTFCLCTMMGIFEANLVAQELIGEPDSSIVHLEEYVDAVKRLREKNPKYNCKVMLRHPNDPKRTIETTLDEFLKQVEELINKVETKGNYNLISYEDILRTAKIISRNPNIDISDKRNAEVIESAIKWVNKTSGDLMMSWKPLQSGERTSFSKSTKYTKRIKDSAARIAAEEARQSNHERMIRCMNYLNSSEMFTNPVEGIDKFEGYVAYLYGNGKVILEQFFENEKEQTAAKSKATYVMNIFEFIDLTKLNKMELSDIIKDLKAKGHKNPSVYKINHDILNGLESWKKKINAAIHGGEYTDEVMSYIELLIDTGVIAKKENKTK